MHRVGAAPADVVGLHRLITAQPHLRLGALMTHFAVADGLDEVASTYTIGQWAGLARVLDTLEDEDLDVPLVHTANSGATLGDANHVAERRELRARSGIVRCGIAVYGLPPDASEEGCRFFAGFGLRPALRLVSEVSFVKTVPAGSKVSYGLHYETSCETVLATVPIGYADGVPRRLSAVGGEVLIGGRRRLIAGAVTMDQIVVDCGLGTEVGVGDEVVLIGRQGDAEITAAEWARQLDTITYEVTTRIGSRVPRVHRLAGGAG
jgi:alanine racemase